MKYTHVIWDWNGTIVDDTSLCVDIVNHILDDFKLEPVTVDFYRDNFRFPVSSYYKKIGFPTDPKSYKKISRKFIQHYRKLFTGCSLQRNSENCILQLNRSNIKQSILSASMQSDLNSFVPHYNISEYFVKLTGVDDTLANGKLEIAKSHLQKLNLSQNDTLLIGDTLHDSHVATSMGVECLLYAGGHNSKKVLSEGRFPVMDCFKDLLQFVLD